MASVSTIPRIIQEFQATPFASAVVLGGLSLSTVLFLLKGINSTRRRKGHCSLAAVPDVSGFTAVPGLPVIGNLLQLKEKKPHKTFANWTEKYGPIYSIKTGYSTVIVLNSADAAKEAMVTRHSSISTRKLTKALQILTSDKCMVAMSDYNEFHKSVKKNLLTNMLSVTAQRRHRIHRDTMVENMSSKLHAHAKNSPAEAVDFRHLFEWELFGLALKEALGKDAESIYVDQLGTNLSREDVFKILVVDPMEGAIEVDWRDFFPYLKWVPNTSVEKKIHQMSFNRRAVMSSLIKEQKKRIASGEDLNCYIDFLLLEAKTLNEEQLSMLLWETIIEASDTTLVVAEWAMYELARDPQKQDHLYWEIHNLCGTKKLTEEDISKLPYLNAVFHETLRRHSPVPIIPMRYVHEDTEIAGHFIPAGSEIAINIYACNMDKKQWESPEVWMPERFIDEKSDNMDLYRTMAFGGGKRVCAGSLQAMLIACTAIGRLIQEFSWRLRDGEEENVDTLALTARKLYPLHLILKPRN